MALDRDAAAEAIARTEEVIERVRGENGFAVAQPEAHARTLWTLKSGVEAIKTKSASAREAIALLVKPLQWLTKKFSEAAIGKLAEAACKAVLKAFGISD